MVRREFPWVPVGPERPQSFIVYEPRVDTLQQGYDICAAKYGKPAPLVPTETLFLPQNIEPSLVHRLRYARPGLRCVAVPRARVVAWVVTDINKQACFCTKNQIKRVFLRRRACSEQPRSSPAVWLKPGNALSCPRAHASHFSYHAVVCTPYICIKSVLQDTS